HPCPTGEAVVRAEVREAAEVPHRRGHQLRAGVADGPVGMPVAPGPQVRIRVGTDEIAHALRRRPNHVAGFHRVELLTVYRVRCALRDVLAVDGSARLGRVIAQLYGVELPGRQRTTGILGFDRELAPDFRTGKGGDHSTVYQHLARRAGTARRQRAHDRIRD